MSKKKFPLLPVFVSALVLFSCNKGIQSDFDMDNLYAWCVVSFDVEERSPLERIEMLKEIGFKKYAYDGEDENLDNLTQELKLAEENDIQVFAVWLWINAKRDSIGKLSPSNEKIFEALQTSGTQTTVWLSFNDNFYTGLTQSEKVLKGTQMADYVNERLIKLGCKLALYNHGSWFGEPENQVEIIKALPQYDIGIIYNFHHGHTHLETFPQIVETMKPYLWAVNLNGMHRNGPEILTIGQGDREMKMINTLIDAGYHGPWGIMSHVKNEDAKNVLERNLDGMPASRF